ncbi:acyl-coenzyme A diphosphatase FITM2 isoform X2 [Stegostoma tigrinum]|uniref:acyl-coenzyme A diphosphatase FITM2 isoform X2 n=1 Tax=Stegostoma tigrinum TaxID=3053191 RepID=UPI00202B3D2D|nr:acyl-coenzyme A diphosphatase FITM2 isoform X2 [Stegostoma tigrinum]
MGSDSMLRFLEKLFPTNYTPLSYQLQWLILPVKQDTTKNGDVGFWDSCLQSMLWYFVKFSWGWTVGLLLPFIFTSNYFLRRDVLFAVRRVTSCVVGTGIWFLSTRTFHIIENFTGECYESQNMTVLHQFDNLYTCKKNGHLWLGFDISGHSFLLSYCVLIMTEEIAVMNELQKVEQKPGKSIATIIKSLFIALNALLFLWVWMFFCTALYFHDMPHKIIGTTFGISAWYGTYRFWYKKPFSPGLPPEIGNKKE